MLRNAFVRHVATLAGGSAVGQAVGIVATPILTRLYTPEDLGHFGLYTSFVTVATVVLTLSYELAVVSADDDREGSYLVLGAVLVSLPLSLVFAFILHLLIQNAILGYGGLPAGVVGLTLLGLLLTPLFSIMRYWLIRGKQFSTISRVTVVNSVSRLGTQVPLGLLGMNWTGLILGDIVGRAISDMTMLWRAMRALRQAWQPLDGAYLLATLRKYRKYPTINVPSAFINAMAASIPVPLVIQYYGTEAGGLFNLSRLMLAIPLRLIGASVADVFHNRMAEYARNQPEECLAFFMRVTRILFLVGLVPGILLALIAPQLFGLVFGPDWILSGYIVVTMVPLLIAQLVVIPISRVVFVFDRQELRLIYDVISFVTPFLAMLYSVGQGYNLLSAALVLNFVNFATYVGLYLMLHRAMQRTHRSLYSG